MVPPTLRPLILNMLHESHMGINKTCKRAREMFYWPLMNSDIEEVIQNCLTCSTFSNSNAKEPMIPHAIPSLPFNKVSCDILEHKGISYLAIMDYYSKWVELKRIRNKSAQEILNVWREVFSCLGIPKVIIADNVPFDSNECRDFAKRWNFEIITSSPSIRSQMDKRKVLFVSLRAFLERLELRRSNQLLCWNTETRR